MTRWEYKSYLFEPRDKVIEVLNSLGKQGWEVIQFRPLPEDYLRVYFKRPLERSDAPPTA